jgi:hypothetical protein
MDANPAQPPVPDSDAASPPTGATRWRDRYRAVLIFAVAGAVAWWIGSSLGPRPAANNGLVVDETDLDFGEAWEDRAFPWKFTVRNPTARDITVKKIWTSCSCAAAKPDSVTIPAGGTAVIHLTLDLRHAFSDRTVPGAGEASLLAKKGFRAEIIPDIENMPSHKPWEVHGLVSKVVATSPSRLDFGDTFVRGQPFSRQKIKVQGNDAVANIEAKCSAQYCRLGVQRSPDGGNEWGIEVSLAPELPVGPFSFQLTILPYDTAGRGMPAYVASVKGVVKDILSPIPAVLLLGAKPLGSRAKGRIVLQQNTERKNRYTVVSIGRCPPTIVITPNPQDLIVDIERLLKKPRCWQFDQGLHWRA